MPIPPDRWKRDQPGGCDCPCGDEYHCRFPCCVYGMRFIVDAAADDQVEPGTNGVFICTKCEVTVNRFVGGQTTSLDHSSFEIVNVHSSGTWRTLAWGGGADMYLFGLLPRPMPEDVLCPAPASSNLEIKLRFKNVHRPAQAAKIKLSSPIMTIYWGFTTKQTMACLDAIAGAVGSWSNLANACSMSTANAPEAQVDYLDEAEIIFRFGPADPAAAPKVCTEIATTDPVLKADIGVILDIPSRYTDAGEICWKNIPCFTSDDAGRRITTWTVESGCGDPDCPNSGQCQCIEEASGCVCGCSGSDVDLGVPHYLDLAKIGVSLSHTDFSIDVCPKWLSSFGLAANAFFCHASDKYGTPYPSGAETPIHVYHLVSSNAWVASFHGTTSIGHGQFTAYGPTGGGTSLCAWHTIRVEYTGTQGRVTVNGVPGSWASAPAGFTLYTYDAQYLGAYNRAQIGGGAGQTVPPGSMRG